MENEFLKRIKLIEAKEQAGKVEVLELKNNVEKLIRIIDERPTDENLHYFGPGKKPRRCLGKQCSMCRARRYTATGFCNAYDWIDKKVKMFCMFGPVLKKIRKVVEENGCPTKYDLKIKKVMSNGRASYLVEKNRELLGQVPKDVSRYSPDSLFIP